MRLSRPKRHPIDQPDNTYTIEVDLIFLDQQQEITRIQTQANQIFIGFCLKSRSKAKVRFYEIHPEQLGSFANAYRDRSKCQGFKLK